MDLVTLGPLKDAANELWQTAPHEVENVHSNLLDRLGIAASSSARAVPLMYNRRVEKTELVGFAKMRPAVVMLAEAYANFGGEDAGIPLHAPAMTLPQSAVDSQVRTYTWLKHV